MSLFKTANPDTKLLLAWNVTNDTIVLPGVPTRRLRSAPERFGRFNATQPITSEEYAILVTSRETKLYAQVLRLIQMRKLAAREVVTRTPVRYGFNPKSVGMRPFTPEDAAVALAGIVEPETPAPQVQRVFAPLNMVSATLSHALPPAPPTPAMHAAVPPPATTDDDTGGTHSPVSPPPAAVAVSKPPVAPVTVVAEEPVVPTPDEPAAPTSEESVAPASVDDTGESGEEASPAQGEGIDWAALESATAVDLPMTTLRAWGAMMSPPINDVSKTKIISRLLATRLSP